MNLDNAMSAYRNDPTFRAIVDSMTCYVMDAHITPAELRAAAVLASINAANLTTRPITVPRYAAEELERMGAIAAKGAA